jgi:hypothetical protein
MKAIAPLHRAQAPSYFTYGSHSAMFAGFTPGLAHLQQPLLNPKFGKLFKIVGGGFPGKGTEGFELSGANIVEGFRNRGYRALGSGAVGWFDPEVPTGRHLTASFDEFFYPGNSWSLKRQISWFQDRLNTTEGDVFAFLNVGETHVPYFHEGASWDVNDNPCVPFQTANRAGDCRLRQTACCNFADQLLASLLDAFASATILICGDHGECWGEDGLWEHGVSHDATLTVPLVLRVRGIPVETSGAARPPSKRLWTWQRLISFRMRSETRQPLI